MIIKSLRKISARLKLKQSGTGVEGHYDGDPFRYPFLRDRMNDIISHTNNKRSHYAWGVLCAADFAKQLNVGRISVLELGVANGAGVKALEEIVPNVEELFNIKIDIYGFDSGTGLPEIKDQRDLPNLWSQGYFRMDKEALMKDLRRTRLFINPVEIGIREFISSNPAPVGFIIFDLDLYSSTKQSFTLFKADNHFFLPRVLSYFDDVHGFTYSDCNGELLAIAEFNRENTAKQISRIYGLRYLIDVHDSYWPEQLYYVHFFDHESYGKNDGLLQTKNL